MYSVFYGLISISSLGLSITKKNVLTIYFPPVLGLGDTILLSQIVPLVRSYFSNITIQVATSTPWVCASTQNVQYISTNDYVALAKTKYLVISAFSPFSPIVKFLLRASIPQPFKIPTKSSPMTCLIRILTVFNHVFLHR